MQTHIKIVLFVVIFFICACSRSGPPADGLKSIIFSSYGFSYENGRIFELRNSIKIAYYKDYMLFQTKAIILKPTDQNAEDTYIDLRDTLGLNTYRYFIIKNGDKMGLLFQEAAKPKIMGLEDMLKYNGLNFTDFPFFCIDVGKPALTERNSISGDLIEKFVNPIKGPSEPDSLYRYYNTKFSGINFSFCNRFDEVQKSKLWKIGLIYRQKSDRTLPKRREAYWKFELYEKDDQLFIKMFKQFIAQERNFKLN